MENMVLVTLAKVNEDTDGEALAAFFETFGMDNLPGIDWTPKEDFGDPSLNRWGNLKKYSLYETGPYVFGVNLEGCAPEYIESMTMNLIGEYFAEYEMCRFVVTAQERRDNLMTFTLEWRD